MSTEQDENIYSAYIGVHFYRFMWASLDREKIIASKQYREFRAGVIFERARKDEWKEEAGRLLARGMDLLKTYEWYQAGNGTENEQNHFYIVEHPYYLKELLTDLEKLCPKK